MERFKEWFREVWIDLKSLFRRFDNWCMNEKPVIAPAIEKVEEVAIAVSPYATVILQGATAMNWGLFLKALQFLPAIYGSIETIHGQSQSGATKQQMALTALAAITGGADSVLNHSNTQIANAASTLAQAVITSTVAAHSALGTASMANTVAAGVGTVAQAAASVANTVTGAQG